jgi:hemerythrin
MITWDESMTTGVPKIDAQHKKLIAKYNEFYAAVTDGSGRIIISEILDFLQFYATWHFGEEEACMNDYQCPVAQANKQAHAYFVALFGQFYEDWQQSSLDADEVQAACTKLGDWIDNHIRRVDTQLYPCVHGP